MSSPKGKAVHTSYHGTTLHMTMEDGSVWVERTDRTDYWHLVYQPDPTKPPVKRFVPPGLDEAWEHMGTEHLAEAHKFINFYESKNWYVGKNKMVSWKGAASNWMRRVNDGKDKQGQNAIELATNTDWVNP
ncbi:hypothetical protein OAA60_00815 [Porticoccaceae bacterium]|nr:hypothetical protein [Porticoccaceae bacterium]